MSVGTSCDHFIHFAGNTIGVTSADPQVCRAIETHFRHCLGEHAPSIATYKITAVDQTGFSISVNGSDLLSKFSLGQAMHFLMQDGLTRLNGASATHLVFHAAALAHHKQGIILCGKSGSGKSTLAAWLTAAGMQYLTDEVISLAVNEENISGFCRSIVLKPGSAFVWRNLTAENSIFHPDDNSAWVSPTLLNPTAPCANVTPRILLFPQYTPGAPLRTQRLTPAEALFRLLQCLVNSRNFPDGGMSAAARLTRQVHAYTLEYSDLETVAQWITQTASKP
ncbi:MAG: hypothetical protein AB1509_07765 [Chloroflexota bacterium]